MPEQEREARLGRIRAFLADRPETAQGEFTLPMLTAVDPWGRLQGDQRHGHRAVRAPGMLSARISPMDSEARRNEGSTSP